MKHCQWLTIFKCNFVNQREGWRAALVCRLHSSHHHFPHVHGALFWRQQCHPRYHCRGWFLFYFFFISQMSNQNSLKRNWVCFRSFKNHANAYFPQFIMIFAPGVKLYLGSKEIDLHSAIYPFVMRYLACFTYCGVCCLCCSCSLISLYLGLFNFH